MKIKNILQSILSSAEADDIQNEILTLSDEELSNYLINKNFFLMVDWSGEEEKYQISRFLESRIMLLTGKQFTINADKAYEVLNKQDNIKRGDCVPFLLNYFEKVLKKQGYTMSLYDRGNDTYYIAVSTVENAAKLRKSRIEPWKFVALNSQTRILYIIHCPDCGDMNVWELSIKDSSPENECCDCGKLLFDNEGNALVPCEKEYC